MAQSLSTIDNISRLNQCRAFDVGIIRALHKILLSFDLLAAISARADQITTAPGFGPYQIGSGGEYTVIPDPPVTAAVSPAPIMPAATEDKKWRLSAENRHACLAEISPLIPSHQS